MEILGALLSKVEFDAVDWSWTNMNMCSLWDSLRVDWRFDLEILAYGVSYHVLCVTLVFRSVWFPTIKILWCFFGFDWATVILLYFILGKRRWCSLFVLIVSELGDFYVNMPTGTMHVELSKRKFWVKVCFICEILFYVIVQCVSIEKFEACTGNQCFNWCSRQGYAE